jgi:hypothetical protein
MGLLDRQGFVPVEDIKEGEHLLSKAGIITVVAKTYDPTPQAVYNLEVGQWHNFLVGQSAVVVHNSYATFDDFLDGLNFTKSRKDALKAFIRANNEYLREWDLISDASSQRIFLETVEDAIKSPRNIGNYPQNITWQNKTIPARPHKQGMLGTRQKQSNQSAEAYELRINPTEESLYIQMSNGKYTQAENLIANRIQDAKHCGPNSLYKKVNEPWAQPNILQEADRQLDAAALHGLEVEWLVNDVTAAAQLRAFFQQNNRNIIVTYYP